MRPLFFSPLGTLLFFFFSFRWHGQKGERIFSPPPLPFLFGEVNAREDVSPVFFFSRDSSPPLLSLAGHRGRIPHIPFSPSFFLFPFFFFFPPPFHNVAGKRMWEELSDASGPLLFFGLRLRREVGVRPGSVFFFQVLLPLPFPVSGRRKTEGGLERTFFLSFSPFTRFLFSSSFFPPPRSQAGVGRLPFHPPEFRFFPPLLSLLRYMVTQTEDRNSIAKNLFSPRLPSSSFFSHPFPFSFFSFSFDPCRRMALAGGRLFFFLSPLSWDPFLVFLSLFSEPDRLEKRGNSNRRFPLPLFLFFPNPLFFFLIDWCETKERRKCSSRKAGLFKPHFLSLLPFFFPYARVGEQAEGQPFFLLFGSSLPSFSFPLRARCVVKREGTSNEVFFLFFPLSEASPLFSPFLFFFFSIR